MSDTVHSVPAARPVVGVVLSLGVTISMSPSVAAQLADDIDAGGRSIRLAEGAHLSLDDVQSMMVVNALRAQIEESA